RCDAVQRRTGGTTRAVDVRAGEVHLDVAVHPHAGLLVLRHGDVVRRHDPVGRTAVVVDVDRVALLDAVAVRDARHGDVVEGAVGVLEPDAGQVAVRVLAAVGPVRGRRDGQVPHVHRGAGVLDHGTGEGAAVRLGRNDGVAVTVDGPAVRDLQRRGGGAVR